MYTRDQFLKLIDTHIKEYGYHITVVTSCPDPRYAYSIGLSDLVNFEIIFAGGIIYSKDEVTIIFDAVVDKLKTEKNINDLKIYVENLGVFSLNNVDDSWCRLMMLGVFDYYKVDKVKAFQIIPDSTHYTLDIPYMSKERTDSTEPVWQWLNQEWDYPVPVNSTVITNINTLFGEEITELTRWENNEWEMFAGAGPDVKKEDLRVVPLGTILGIDKSILPALKLDIGEGLWRDSRESEWNNWE
jgi:hypothetical protein